jgi:hypothetical protein
MAFRIIEETIDTDRVIECLAGLNDGAPRDRPGDREAPALSRHGHAERLLADQQDRIELALLHLGPVGCDRASLKRKCQVRRGAASDGPAIRGRMAALKLRFPGSAAA